MSNIVIVNGKRYQCDSGNITVVNNKVYCNGKLVSDTNSEFAEKEIHITIEGNVNDISVTAGNVSVKGTADSVSAKSGDVYIGMDVLGECKTVSGDITVQGNVYNGCNTVSGNIRATYTAASPRDIPEQMRRSYVRTDISTGQIDTSQLNVDKPLLNRNRDVCEQQEESIGTLFLKEIKNLYHKSINWLYTGEFALPSEKEK